MPASTSPIFPSTPKTTQGTVPTGAGTTNDIFTAHATYGSIVNAIVIVANSSAVRPITLQINKSGTITKLCSVNVGAAAGVCEQILNATNLPNLIDDDDKGLRLEAGAKLQAVSTTNVANALDVTTFGGDYVMPS